MSDDKLTPAEHLVRPGDHLSRVAATFGFRSFGPLWNDPANAALRKRRTNPHILAVDDPVHVPELVLREVDRGTEQKHRFKAEVHPLHCKLSFSTWDREQVKDQPTDVLLDGKSAPFQAGGPGEVIVPVGTLTDRCVVKYPDREFTFRVGFIQPGDTVAGQRRRLENLGYRPGDADDPTHLEFRSAVEEFQCDQGLTVDGKVGPATRAALVKAHGC